MRPDVPVKRRVGIWRGALLWFVAILAWQSLRHLGPQEDAQAVAQAHVASRLRGQAAVEMCAACHTLTFRENRIGPPLVDVIGRRAGTEPGYAYSDAMRSSGLVWDRDTLRRFLQDPRGTVPGTAMAISGVAPEDVQAIIDFLEDK
ncbi:hypothetical protein ASF43_08610 [Pseudorhodoferax sp. Leaf267]|nr:hypothetical protein ASF43_08610 [Pseudorhodoferax sp. Leaf267]